MDVPAQTHQTNNQDQRYHKMIYNSILVTKESNNKMNDYNIIHFMGKESYLHQDEEELLQPLP